MSHLMLQPNFGEDCKGELQEREDVMKTDYRCVAVSAWPVFSQFGYSVMAA